MLELNKIYNVDCLDGFKSLDDGSIDLIVTSPPYFNAREYAQWENYRKYLEFIQHVLFDCKRVLKDGGFICWNVSPRIVVSGKKYSLGFDSQKLLEEQFIFYDNLVWVKPEGGYRLSFAETKWAFMSKNGDRPVRLMPRYENIFIYSKGDPFTNRFKAEKQIEREYWHWGNILKLGVDHLPGHSGVFPLQLPLTLIDWFGLGKKIIVLDPFMGRGTTARAARMLGHDYIGFEFHQEYIDYSDKYVNGE